ncbi:MAG: lysylphosphatidylglycerol synthase transmembrane domain-containing protein [Gammaproteobacteria bacterium]
MNDEHRTGIGVDAPVASGRFHRILMPLISLTLFFVAIAAIHHLLTEVSYPQLVAELKALSWNQLLLALLFTASSFMALMGYDWSALTYIGRKLPFPTVALGSFCGYAISNTVGLSMLSGGSVRYRFYLSAGLDAADIARVSMFSILALSLGIYLVGSAALVIHPEFVDGFFGSRRTRCAGSGSRLWFCCSRWWYSPLFDVPTSKSAPGICRSPVAQSPSSSLWCR